MTKQDFYWNCFYCHHSNYFYDIFIECYEHVNYLVCCHGVILLFLLVTFKNFIVITVFVAIIWEAWLSDYIPLRKIYCTRHKNKCLFSSWYYVLQMYFTWINISIGVVFGIEYLPTKKTVGRISSNIQHLWYPNLSIQ